MIPVGIRGLHIHELVVSPLGAPESAAPASKGPARGAWQPTVARALSQVDLFVAHRRPADVVVSTGAKVRAGETVLVR